MDRTLAWVIWIGMLSTFVFGSHYYLWLRLVRDTSLSSQPKLITTAIIISLAVCMLAGPFIAHQYPEGIGLWGMRLAYSWLGMVFFLLMIFWFKDALHFFYFLLKKFSIISTSDLEPERRLFLQRVVHGGMALGGLGVGALPLKKFCFQRVAPLRAIIDRCAAAKKVISEKSFSVNHWPIQSTCL